MNRKRSWCEMDQDTDKVAAISECWNGAHLSASQMSILANLKESLKGSGFLREEPMDVC